MSAKVHRLAASNSEPKNKGGRPPKRKTVREAFDFSPLLPVNAPDHLSTSAKELFNGLVLELSKTGCHSTADVPLIAQLADSMALYAELRVQIAREGMLVEGARGGKHLSPLQYALIGERQTILSLSSALLMSPKARGGQLKKMIDEVVADDAADKAADEPELKLASGKF